MTSIPHPAIWMAAGVPDTSFTPQTICEMAEELSLELMGLLGDAMRCPVGQEIEFDNVKFEKRTDYIKAVRECILFLSTVCNQQDACYQYIPPVRTIDCRGW